MLEFVIKHKQGGLELTARYLGEGRYSLVKCVDGVWRTSAFGLTRPELDKETGQLLADSAKRGLL